MIEVGQTVLRGLKSSYKVVELLDQGPLSAVYIGIEQEFGEHMALKVMPKKLDKQGAFARKFRHEARILNELKSAYVPQIRDWGSSDDYIFIATEHVPGKTLARLLAESKTGMLEESQVLGLAGEIGRALMDTYAAGIVHRDIKPQNILATRDGSVRILDFGLAELLDLSKVSGAEAVGTFAYLAPELTEEAGIGDIRSDIYSTGATMYELLGGRAPFEGSTLLQLVMKIMQAPPVPLKQLRPDLMPETCALVDRCLEKRPERRFPTPAEFLHAAQQIGVSSAKSRPAVLYDQIQKSAEAGDWRRVLVLCDELSAIDPNYSDVQGYRARAIRRLQEEQQGDRVALLFAEAAKAAESGDWGKARELCARIEVISPGLEHVAQLRARIPLEPALSPAIRREAVLRHADGAELYVHGPEGTVGRLAGCDIDLSRWDSRKYISKRHARLFWEENSWRLEALKGARNPTKINGTILPPGERRQLSPGDELEFAGVVLLFDER